MNNNRLSSSQEQKLYTQFSKIALALAMFSLVFMGIYIQEQEMNREDYSFTSERQFEEYVPSFLDSLSGENIILLEDGNDKKKEKGKLKNGKKRPNIRTKTRGLKIARQNSDAIRVSISNSRGSMIWAQWLRPGKDFKDLKLDLNKLSPGMYLMKFEGPSSIISSSIEVKARPRD